MFTVVFFVIMFVNLVIADRLAPKYRSMGPEDELIARYQQVDRAATPVRIRIGVVAVLRADRRHRRVVAVEAVGPLHPPRQTSASRTRSSTRTSASTSSSCRSSKFIAEWLFAGLVIVLIVTAVEHYLNGGIRFQSPFQRVTPQVKAHLSVILAVMALVKTAQYYLGRFELNFSTRGVVEGASYTDVKAQLPALNLLIFISIVAARAVPLEHPAPRLGAPDHRGRPVGVRVAGDRHDLPGGLSSSSRSARTSTRPRRSTSTATSAPRATRSASTRSRPRSSTSRRSTTLPVDRAQTVVDSNTRHDRQRAAVGPERDRATPTSTLQNLQTYYQIGDVDVDRYLVDNETRQVLIAARDLNSADLPSQSFVNRHIVYTHGYGVVASPSNEADADGTPDFYLSDIPIERASGIKLGERAGVADLLRREPRRATCSPAPSRPSSTTRREGKTDQFTRYKGKDGVQLSNFVRRAAFALRFGTSTRYLGPGHLEHASC